MVNREETPYNPLDKKNLAESVAEAMLARPVESLPPPDSFIGSGIYALYYMGKFAPYKRLAKLNREAIQHDPRLMVPIYVGRARPKGARKGLAFLEPSTGKALYTRLAHHSATIRKAENLEIEDFKCRYLVVDEIWIPLGETLLISNYHPLWNGHVDGFGNNMPGGNRETQKNSFWDLLHPGRSWAKKLSKHTISLPELTRDIQTYWENNLVQFEEKLVAEKGSVQ